MLVSCIVQATGASAGVSDEHGNCTFDDNGNTVPVLEGPRKSSMACRTISENKMELKPLYASKWLVTKWNMSKTDHYFLCVVFVVLSVEPFAHATRQSPCAMIVTKSILLRCDAR